MARAATLSMAPRPLQNRVTPFGEIVAVAERGTLMGNRGGCMHDELQRLGRRRWVNARWITCLLEFRGWHREVMQPRRYTEFFFLDEATAFAAGHRPCGECRHRDFLRFREAWLAGNPEAGVRPADSIDRIDAVLHRERVGREGSRPTFEAQLGDLPRGVIVALGDGAALWWDGSLLPWSHAGYGRAEAPAPRQRATVLTPASTVAAFRAGYEPAVHPSARG